MSKRLDNNQNPTVESFLDLSKRQLSVLRDRWITSARDLVAVSHEGPSKIALAAECGVRVATLDSWRERALNQLPPELRDQTLFCADTNIYGLGLLEEGADCSAVDASALIEAPAPMTIRSLPGQVHLEEMTPDVGNQGRRGTCVAWSMAYEFSYLWSSILGHKNLFSPQFAYWCYKHEIDKNEYPGTSWATAIEGAVFHGMCSDSLWSYNPEPWEDNESQGPPPKGCVKDALSYRCRGFVSLIEDDVVESIQSMLAGPYGIEARPVVIGVPVSTSWRNAETLRTGKIFIPGESDDILGYHAMLVEGYDQTEPWNNAPGGGVFITRNSWGPAWASESPFKAGYAMIPFDYISNYQSGAFAMVALEEEVVSNAKKTFSFTGAMSRGHHANQIGCPTGRRYSSLTQWMLAAGIAFLVLCCIYNHTPGEMWRIVVDVTKHAVRFLRDCILIG